MQSVLSGFDHASFEMLEYARKFTKDQRDALAQKKQALPDGSYPVENRGDLKNAIKLAKSGHGNVAGAKALIKKMAKKLDAEDLLPADWTEDGEGNGD